MQIDWFTLGAQIVNFLIILALLKRFLYDRIVGAMDKREEQIASRLKEAAKTREEAEEEKHEFRRKSEELEGRRDGELARAREKGEEERRRMLKEARGEVEERMQEWRQSLEHDRETFLRTLRRTTGEHVEAVSRKVLEDLADDDLERRTVQAFLRRLGDLDEEEERALEELSEDGIVVRTSFEPGKKERDAIAKALGERLDTTPELEFRTSRDLICGIELHGGGRVIAWSVDRYLNDLEEAIAREMTETARTEEEGNGGEKQRESTDDSGDEKEEENSRNKRETQKDTSG